MLAIDIEEQEFFNNETQMFFKTKPYKVRLEHSLISVSKWEAYWKKPYLPSRFTPGISGRQEEIHYYTCMVIGQTPPQYVFEALYESYKRQIADYIADTHTATTKYVIGEQKLTKPGKSITTEMIYYWMIRFGIPFECEKWHLNRLFALIEVCLSMEKAPKNKLSPREAARWRNELNEQRKKQWDSR